jgi:hypothetical protein
LYEVEPIGELWPDPAPMMAAGTVASRCCTRARVVRLVGTCPAAGARAWPTPVRGRSAAD